MGNSSSNQFSYGEFLSLLNVDNFPGLTRERAAVLIEFLRTIQRGEPTQELFEKASLAIPKSLEIKRIHAAVESKRFKSIPEKRRVYLSHVYALIIFMWARFEGTPPIVALYKSDTLQHALPDAHSVHILLESLRDLLNEKGAVKKHFVSRAEVESSSSSEEARPKFSYQETSGIKPIYNLKVRRGGQTTIGYLEEILDKLNILLRSQNIS